MPHEGPLPANISANQAPDNPVPHDTPEIRTQVDEVLSRATAVVLEAPEVTDPDVIEHPTSERFEIVAREASIGPMHTSGEGVRIVYGHPSAEVRGAHVPEGGALAVNSGYEVPMQGARNKYDALVSKMTEEDSRVGRVVTTAQRQLTVGGQPATVLLELTQHVLNGKLTTAAAKFSVRRPLPDNGDVLQQTLHVTQPGDYNTATDSQDAIIEPGSPFFRTRDDAARAVVAATNLPDDPNLSYTHPMGFDECKYILG